MVNGGASLLETNYSTIILSTFLNVNFYDDVIFEGSFAKELNQFKEMKGISLPER
jgi:hypothetical protein